MGMKSQIKTIRVKGYVFSGFGIGKEFTGLSWFKRQVRDKLGFDPYPGTLNLKLDRACGRIKEILRKAKPTVIASEYGYCRGKCFRVCIMDSIEGAVVIPEVEKYPDDVLEVIAPINLREKFKLKDGDQIILSIMLE